MTYDKKKLLARLSAVPPTNGDALKAVLLEILEHVLPDKITKQKSKEK